MVLAATLLVACTSPTVQAPAPEPQRPPEQEVPRQDASSGLRVEAAELRKQGELERAEGLLLRAQRIDPRNALVYLALAELYQDMGDYYASSRIAERGLLYCAGSTCKELNQLIQ